MSDKKKIKSILCIVLTIALFSTVLYLAYTKSTSSTTTSSNGTASKNASYVDSVFNKDKVMEINIEMDKDDLQDMFDNALDTKYKSANITINGTKYENVAIKPKGNTTLTQIANDDTTDRYSFKLKFDKYVDDQTLDGLSKLVLNNCMSDTTYMKEYLSYDLLSTLGVNTPAYSYAHITINGEEWGLYLAVEPIEEEFIERYYGDASGNLYKPESDDISMPKQNNVNNDNNNNNGNMTPPTNEVNGENGANNNMPTPPNMPNGNMPTPPNMQNGENGEMPSPPDMNFEDMPSPPNGSMGGDMNRDTNGADLVWNGDDIEDYSAIFDNAEFKHTTEEDYEKILTMIEHLDSLDNIEKYLDVDGVLKYFAANTFLVNLDSYASFMKHNYYLYETNGVVSILPWDYNLSFGGFQGGSASNVINFPIDSPVSGSLESSPLIGKLLEVDEYKEKYHEYLNEIVENYINNGTYENTINKLNTLISPYVEKDATAFYTFEEYTNSIPHLIAFGKDRANSISAQLSGAQPSTTAGNIETTVDLNALGQQGPGGKDDKNKNRMIPPNMNSNSTLPENNS